MKKHMVKYLPTHSHQNHFLRKMRPFETDRHWLAPS
jgi:hypothetical protein